MQFSLFCWQKLLTRLWMCAASSHWLVLQAFCFAWRALHWQTLTNPKHSVSFSLVLQSHSCPLILVKTLGWMCEMLPRCFSQGSNQTTGGFRAHDSWCGSSKVVQKWKLLNVTAAGRISHDLKFPEIHKRWQNLLHTKHAGFLDFPTKWALFLLCQSNQSNVCHWLCSRTLSHISDRTEMKVEIIRPAHYNEIPLKSVAVTVIDARLTSQACLSGFVIQGAQLTPCHQLFLQEGIKYQRHHPFINLQQIQTLAWSLNWSWAVTVAEHVLCSIFPERSVRL